MLDLLNTLLVAAILLIVLGCICAMSNMAKTHTARSAVVISVYTVCVMAARFLLGV